MMTFPSATTSFVFWLYVSLSERILMSWYSTRTLPLKIPYSSFCASTTPPLPTVMLTSPPPGFGPGTNLNFGRSWDSAMAVTARRSRQSAVRRIRVGILPALLRPRPHRAIDPRHVLQLHAQLDDLELIQPRDLLGASALLALAEGDAVRDADELAMGGAVVPAAAAEAEDRVGGGAHVLVVDHADRGFVAQLGAHGRPLAEHGQDGDERDDRGDGDRGLALGQGQQCDEPGGCDRDRHRDRVDSELARSLAHVRESERDAIAGHRAGHDALREAEELVLAAQREGRRCGRAGHCAQDHAVRGLALAAGEPYVQRDQREHDPDRERIVDEPEQRARDQARDQRIPRVASMRAVEVLEIRRGRERGEERGDENEREDGIGHSSGRLCIRNHRRERSMSWRIWFVSSSAERNCCSRRRSWWK